MSPKPTLWLANPRDLQSVIASIERLSGEKLTPEEIEELRQLLEINQDDRGKREDDKP